MPTIIPSFKPRLSAEELNVLAAPFNINRALFPVVVIGIRGYYKDQMGAPGVNDRGIYDDAIFIDTPSVTAAYNGNTDPSSYRNRTSTMKGMATLNPGAWFVHKFDYHKGQYLALCQRLGEVTVTRDGDPPYQDTGEFGINIHKGGYRGTSSEGCQTIAPEQWESFITLAADQAKRYHGQKWNQVVIPYILLVNA